jgi:hypothetical protein
MAEAWIKMRVDLHESPQVSDMSTELGCPETLVVGCLHKLWSWADKHTVDGNASCVTEIWVDRHTGVSGFGRAMINVGWLVPVDNSTGRLAFPEFEKHNGKSAKKRALGNIRTSNSRELQRSEQRIGNAEGNAKSNARGVTKALPDKKRKEKNKTNASAPERAGLDGADLSWIPEKPWAAYEDMRKQARKVLTVDGLKAVLDELLKLREAGNDVGEVLMQSVRCGYLDVFPVTQKRAGGAVQVTAWWATAQGIMDEATRLGIGTLGKPTAQLVSEIKAKQAAQ